MLNVAIARGGGAFMMLGSMSAEQRVAAFMLDLSDRWQARGYCASAFSLKMTRGEIGSRVGLKTETVNRVLQGMHKRGIIEVYASEIHILDLPSLILL
ncbi:MAG TPA: helix-turn-helix domain-containing protein [Trinickia sp.]|jgi:CRP/FNR family transcriptional regulator|uniref:helix-turn-helix domain-containing protein n=1 Tax=Trinickia sp. TaxID=2571163 RepID=UPI002B78727E|nr:helix-turn-helix domain-containing protein [Trinickia sp.]HVW48831.1 helix-turn-helix domain-containing protein [Trinickia sp.]